jgi:hypothetical protein
VAAPNTGAATCVRPAAAARARAAAAASRPGRGDRIPVRADGRYVGLGEAVLGE